MAIGNPIKSNLSIRRKFGSEMVILNKHNNISKETGIATSNNYNNSNRGDLTAGGTNEANKDSN